MCFIKKYILLNFIAFTLFCSEIYAQLIPNVQHPNNLKETIIESIYNNIAPEINTLVFNNSSIKVSFIFLISDVIDYLDNSSSKDAKDNAELSSRIKSLSKTNKAINYSDFSNDFEYCIGDLLEKGKFIAHDSNGNKITHIKFINDRNYKIFRLETGENILSYITFVY
jgi:hypothetical protein